MGKAANGFLFLCDPEKNTECSKTNCHINGGDCSHTRKGIYAKDPSKVTMVIPTDGAELGVPSNEKEEEDD